MCSPVSLSAVSTNSFAPADFLALLLAPALTFTAFIPAPAAAAAPAGLHVVGNPAIDSNPVDLLFDGFKIVVADAGGNALDVVRPFGGVSNLAVFPGGQGKTPAYQAVPTAVVKGPDGFYYMSQLTGFPFIPGAANIFRVNPRTGAYTVFKGGFTNLMDLAFGRDGTLYALSIAKNGLLNGTEGAIYAISRRGQVRELALPDGTLNEPGGIAVGPGGLYVSNNGGSPGGGQVLKIRGRF